ncbi:MAG: GAF domain-containing protein [Thermoflexales bacterium]|nr:GAF domain-containing protein [Thermoflexales bacterium]
MATEANEQELKVNASEHGALYQAALAECERLRQLHAAALAERDQLRQLHVAALAVQRAPSLVEKLRRVAEAIRELGWQRVVIALRDEDMELTELISAGQGEEHIVPQRMLPPQEWQRRLSGELKPFKIGQSYFVPVDGLPVRDESWQTGDELFIPVRDQIERMMCIISLDAPLDGRRPTPESLPSLELFAQEVAAHIETAQLYKALQDQIIPLGERARRLALLNLISNMLSSTLDLQTMLANVSEQVVQAFGVDHCSIVLYDHDSRVASCMAEQPALGMIRHTMSLRECPLVDRLQTSPLPIQVWVSGDGDLLGKEMQFWLGQTNIETALIVPLIIQDRLIGWFGLNLIQRQRVFSAEQIELGQTIANQTAAAVENARLFERVQSTLHKLESTNRTQAQLLATVQELSTPVVPVLDGILILPLIGFIDSDRAQRIMEGLLSSIEQNRAAVILLDVTGVPVVDSGVAEYLMRAARAAQLLGARPVLVGIRPEVAQAIVDLGVHLRDLVTRSDLQSGLEYALSITQRRIMTIES